MFLKYKLFILPAALLALSSCAKDQAQPKQNSQSQNQASSLVKIENVASYQDAIALVKTTTLHCADSKDCPAFVGMFLAADKAGGFSSSDSVAACTAVLVGEDLALTNSHCIPSAVKLLP